MGIEKRYIACSPGRAKEKKERRGIIFFNEKGE